MPELIRRFAGFSYSAESGLQRDGEQIQLGPQARQLLELLLESEGGVVSKDAIAARLWPDRPASDDSIDRCAYLLRKPLREAGAGDLIATSYGRGLSLRAQIECLDPETAPRAVEPTPNARILDLWQTAYELAGNRTREGFERAQIAIDAAAELDPNSAAIGSLAADIAAGRVIRGFLRPAAAAEMIENAAGRALAIAPDFVPALAVLGWARAVLLRRPEDGLALLDRAVALDPRYAKARSYRSWALVGLGQLDAALADAEEGLRASPLDQALLSLRAWETLCAGDVDASLRLAREGFEQRPDAGTLLLVNAIASGMQGRRDEAVAIARRAVTASPGDPFLMCVLASAQAAAGETRQAEETLAAATRDDSAAAPTAFLAAPVLALGRRDEALALLARGQAEGCPWFSFAAFDPRLAPLRDEIARLKQDVLAPQN